MSTIKKIRRVIDAHGNTYIENIPEAEVMTQTSQPVPASEQREVEMGHISGKGEFYSDILDVPRFHNTMMVIKVGLKIAKAARERNRADTQEGANQ